MDNRLEEINFLLSEYSLGRFDKRLSLSKRLDEVDAVTNGVNMLGEELKSITISRNYFTNIFNSVSDMVFILNNKGQIHDVNQSAEQQLKYKLGSMIGKMFNDLHKGKLSFFNHIKNQLKQTSSLVIGESFLQSSDGILIHVRIHVSHFKNERKRRLILLSASDITSQMKSEKLIIRAIIDTQEKERQRLAKDLHDSLTQQLSAIKFYISTVADLMDNRKQKTILVKSNAALAEVITDMRNVCFNLMPKSLDEFGLVKSVQEFCNHFLYHKKAKFIIEQNRNLPKLSPELKIDMYRVIQEFITNSINHGKASQVSIFFSYNKKMLTVILKDNGKGFDINKRVKGMGLQNVRSRIKSHNGDLNITSSTGQGTQYKIAIPLINI